MSNLSTSRRTIIYRVVAIVALLVVAFLWGRYTAPNQERAAAGSYTNSAEAFDGYWLPNYCAANTLCASQRASNYDYYSVPLERPTDMPFGGYEGLPLTIMVAEDSTVWGEFTEMVRRDNRDGWLSPADERQLVLNLVNELRSQNPDRDLNVVQPGEVLVLELYFNRPR